jgi:hypothetical protein
MEAVNTEPDKIKSITEKMTRKTDMHSEELFGARRQSLLVRLETKVRYSCFANRSCAYKTMLIHDLCCLSSTHNLFFKEIRILSNNHNMGEARWLPLFMTADVSIDVSLEALRCYLHLD